ncbi:MAG: porin [Saprospiraceae bacterium]|nr:hypothetical protein [Lewinella sp.]
MKKSIIILALAIGVFGLLHAQSDTSSFSQKLAKYKIKASVGLQLWTTYTTNMEYFNAEQGRYEAVDNRLNTQLRRTRLTLKGQPYENLTFNLTASLDLVGKDVMAATEAGANNGASPSFRVWNAFVQWRLLPKKEHLYLTAGYFAPQIGRESITAALRSTSMEKAWSQNYLRTHLTGIGPGRAMGLNLGGIIPTRQPGLQFGYELGVFNPVFESLSGNSTGNRFSPLTVGRATIDIGDPENPQYSISHKINYFGKRKGLTLGAAIARQGRTDLFHENRAAGMEVLLNYGPLNLDGDYYLLERGMDASEVTGSFKTKGQTGYLRLSYNIDLPAKLVLEPVAMYWFYNGAMTAEEQERALEVKSFAGQDESLDIGANLYFNPDLKISLHYTLRWGDAGESEPGATFNNYFRQSGLGAIRRGNWIGLGLIGIF